MTQCIARMMAFDDIAWFYCYEANPFTEIARELFTDTPRLVAKQVGNFPPWSPRLRARSGPTSALMCGVSRRTGAADGVCWSAQLMPFPSESRQWPDSDTQMQDIPNSSQYTYRYHPNTTELREIPQHCVCRVTSGMHA